MVVRLGDLKFKNRQAVSYQDMRDTIKYVYTNNMLSNCQDAYQILQTNNIYENKDYFVVDEFVDSNGTNGTVNTGSSTSLYDSSNDYYSNKLDTTELASGVFNNDTGTSNFTISIKALTTGFISQVSFISNRSNPTTQVITISIVGIGQVAQKSIVTSSYSGYVVEFEETDYSTLISNDDTVEINITGQIVRASPTNYFVFNGTFTETIGSVTLSFHPNPYEFTQTLRNLSTTLLIDTNTKTLTGNEKLALVYADSEIPTNTTLTVTLSDGTNEITSNLNEVIDIRSLSSGTLELTFNLNTEDTDITPTISGYSVIIK